MAGRIQRAALTARLAREDPVLALRWARIAGALWDALGEPTCRRIGVLVLRTGRASRDVARALLDEVPEQAARLPASERADYLALVEHAVAVSPRAAPLVARVGADVLRGVPSDARLGFLAAGLARFERSEHEAEGFLRRHSEAGIAAVAASLSGVALADVRRTLALYTRAHCGYDVGVRALPDGGSAYTDGVDLWLPERVDWFGDDRDRLVYRVLAARLAGYLELGTFDVELDAVPGPWPEGRAGELVVERALRAFPLRRLAHDLFHAVEDARVERGLRERYPGIARDLDRLRTELPAPGLPRDAPGELVLVVRALAAGAPVPRGLGADPLARVEAVRRALGDAEVPAGAFAALPGLYALAMELMPAARGEVRYTPPPSTPLDVDLRLDAMGARERAIERHLQRLRREGALDDAKSERGTLREQAPTDLSFEDTLAWLERQRAPGGALIEREEREKGQGMASLPQDGGAVGGRWVYPEWDATLSDYKPAWVRVRELPTPPSGAAFASDALSRHRALVDALRKQFEVLRPELRRVPRLEDGDALDLAAVVDAVVERRRGGAPSDRVYSAARHDRRDVVGAFLVDLSSSTNEVVAEGGRSILDLEKEALVVLSEALDALGDPFAVFGFSGYGREDVSFHVAKDFDEPLDDVCRARVGGLDWKLENRDGAAIRHATARLAARSARVRLLFLLSDGRPLDCGCDRYHDRYAQEDTRVALQEARAVGVHPFCLTVDPRGSSYLGEMYGKGHYLVVDRVEALAHTLPRLYRRLTR